MRVFGVAGWKNSGKTGLVERLVKEIIVRGYSVSTVKHAHHVADVDHEGTDSFRHRTAGASQVVLSSPKRWAVMSELRDQEEPQLDELLDKLDPVDLILIEGYKTQPHPKIEAYRAVCKTTPIARENRSVVAVASDVHPEVPVPVLNLDDTAAIADFILEQVGLDPKGVTDA